MKKCVFPLKWFFVFCLFLFVILLLPNSLLADDFSDWYHGTSGYDEAAQEGGR